MNPGWCGSWIEHQTANRKVTGLIPSQGTRLGCGPGPVGGAQEAMTH